MAYSASETNFIKSWTFKAFFLKKGVLKTFPTKWRKCGVQWRVEKWIKTWLVWVRYWVSIFWSNWLIAIRPCYDCLQWVSKCRPGPSIFGPKCPTSSWKLTLFEPLWAASPQTSGGLWQSHRSYSLLWALLSIKCLCFCGSFTDGCHSDEKKCSDGSCVDSGWGRCRKSHCFACNELWSSPSNCGWWSPVQDYYYYCYYYCDHWVQCCHLQHILLYFSLCEHRFLVCQPSVRRL